MDEQRGIRASDSERQAVVEQLRSALNEGRLNLLEYDNRIALAYQSVTHGDLADLLLDLPKQGILMPRREPAPTLVEPFARQLPEPPSGVHFGRLPTWIRILWTIWLTAVCVNLVVWLMVSVSGGSPAYFWPMWVAGPFGATVFGLSVGATATRRGRREAALRRGLAEARRRRDR
jgi:hypothetical protein